VLDHDSALACCDFITTIVNNADIIPRASLSNLMIFVEFLRAVAEKLDEKGMSPKNFESAAAFLRMLTSGNSGGSKDKIEMLMTTDEFRDAVRNAIEKVELRDPDHLYVPGRVMLMYDLWSKRGYDEKRDEKKEKKVEGGDEGEGEEEVEARTAERLQVTDGTSNILRCIEVDDRMITDHLSPGYRSSIRSLLLASATASS